MNPAEPEIEGAEALTQTFGYWPSFHDSEVLDFNLSRGNVDPETESWDFPSISSRIHVFEMTSEVDPNGFLVLRHHCIVGFRFLGIDDLQLDGFNHQNALSSLAIELVEKDANHFKVTFGSAFGLEASFACTRVLIESVTPCTPKGVPYA